MKIASCKHLKIVFLLVLFWLPQRALSQSLSQAAYDIGSPNVVDYYIDPSVGSDNNAGTSRSQPRKSVTSIWDEIAQNAALTTGVRINLLPGTYGTNHLPNYWENRIGTALAPIIIRAADGFGTVFFSRDINMAGVSYFYLIGVDIKNQSGSGFGDAFHCERCNYILLRGSSFNGAPNGRNAGGDVAHETIKFNQSQYVFIENNNIQGADDNAIDWVAVQYGHIRGNRIHDAAGWCAYVKGGSSYILIESNIAYNCGEGGITAGQGTGFEFMENPWLRFEANYVKVVNNIIHDIEGAALGVNGGYNVLLAHNTAYRVGTRSHLIEVVYGERSCDGDTAACAARVALGGWGPALIGSDNAQPIGNRNITIANNVVYNPAGVVSGSQHFAIYGPRTPTASGIPSPQVTDTGLIIRGNVLWNGSSAMPLGIEDGDQGCQSGNATCNQTQLLSDNTINSFEPDFVAAGSEDFRPAQNGTLAAQSSASIADFSALDTSLNPIPEGVPGNTMVREFSGATVTNRPPGAIVSSASSIDFPSSGDSGTTPDGGSHQGPSVSIKKATAKRAGKRVKVTLQVNASDADGVSSVVAMISAAGKEIGTATLSLKKGSYTGKVNVKSKGKKLSARVLATDSQGDSNTASKTFKVK